MRIVFLSAHVGMGLLLVAATAWGQSEGQPQSQQSVPWNNPQAQANARQQEANAAGERRQANAAYARMQENMMRLRIMNSRKPGVVLPMAMTEEELTPNERKGLTPVPEDLKTYAEFLRQPASGIFRLLRVKPDYGKVVKADESPGYLIGGGAHYSFTKLNHNADKWSDMCWQDEAFVVGIAGQSLGVLTELGDVRLEEIGLESRGVDYLVRLVPAVNAAGAEQQFLRLDSGITANGYGYHLSLPWKLNTTYALRSVNYGRSDMLVAFRAVRQDANDSLIILWKKLKSDKAPSLKKENKK